MCSHLESTKQHSKERMNQLKIAMDHMKKASVTSTVVFGGDCNLRDTEVSLYDVSLMKDCESLDVSVRISEGNSCHRMRNL